MRHYPQQPPLHKSLLRKQLPHFCGAWSLLELLVVLSLMAIIAALAGPKLLASWRLQQLHDERQRLVQQLHFGRLTSLQTNAKVSLCWASECGSSGHFLMYHDSNSDGQWQSTETSLSRWQLPPGVTLKFNRGSQISFNGAGNTAQSGTLVVCAAGQNRGLSLVLSSSGRLRQSEAACE